jgi:hypothetical protein
MVVDSAKIHARILSPQALMLTVVLGHTTVDVTITGTAIEKD